MLIFVFVLSIFDSPNTYTLHSNSRLRTFIILLLMNPNPKKETLENFSENFTLTAKELEKALEQDISRVRSIHIRWQHLKIHETMDDMRNILFFMGEWMSFSFKRSEIYYKFCILLHKLKWDTFDIFNVKILQIIQKYLKGIQKFLSETSKQGLQFYRKLFESTIIAIVREVHWLEKTLP